MHAPIGRSNALATRLVAVRRQTITAIIMESRNSPEPLGPGELRSSSRINSSGGRH
jgi:hypothetical protein